ncbi:MAG: DNA mismatch repair protein MutS [Crocinitomicaceae bacterium]|nr:DNA mismatch repair protein MutS [Crocinitomicaceae bacterium]
MDPHSFYQNNVQEHAAIVKKLKARLRVLSVLRLTVFLIMAAIPYFLWGNVPVISIGIAIGLAIFLLLVSKYSDLKHTANYHKQLIAINEVELKVIDGDLSGLKTGEEYIYENHHFNQDIDLFGQGSIFQIINRTEIKKGEQLLANWLNSNSIDNIADKQKSIHELNEKAKWRQHYKASAALIKTEVSSSVIIKWIKNYTAFVPNAFKAIPIIFSVLSIGVMTLYAIDIISWIELFLWLVVGLIITGPYVKRITKLYNASHQMKETFAQYAQLLSAVESESFESEVLKEQQERIKTEGVKASLILKSISKQIDYLGNRNNMIFAPLMNGFFLWDLFFAYRIEQWMNNFDSAINDWFDVIEYFDAANSLGNLAFNKPSYIYPEISEKSSDQITAKGLGHPLLNTKAMVTNDININNEDFFIITGANMAGKSTFLRTVAVNLVMANCGLPVCAEEFSYRPIKLISSMRTSDSLTNDESYFFSELKRLKFIVESIETDTYFIILDEILKGTNSKDKAEGSQKFVERLVASNSTGLIATHDLSLCQLSDKLPEIQNHYFDAEIVDDELFFDYTFKEGICQNMNASFLLKKMNIV